MKRVATGISPIIMIDRKAPKALPRQIYDAIRTTIVDGGLRPGQRIPSNRMLASELGVSRLPVLNAYSQLLAEGYFESRVGAGTIVSKSLPDQITSSGTTRATGAKALSGPRPVSHRSSILPRFERAPWLRGWGAFGVGQVAFDQFPLQTWSSLVARHSRNMGARSFHYGESIGSPALRETLASYLRIALSVRSTSPAMLVSRDS